MLKHKISQSIENLTEGAMCMHTENVVAGAEILINELLPVLHDFLSAPIYRAGVLGVLECVFCGEKVGYHKDTCEYQKIKMISRKLHK